MVSTLCAQTAVDGTAKVVRIKGSARYSVGDATAWRPLKVGAVLRPGTIVQTDREQGTYVDLALGEGDDAPLPTPVVANPMAPSSTPPPSSASYQPKSEQNMLRITQNTVLGIDRLTSLNTGAEVVTDTQLDLKAGRILGNVKKMSATSKYEVKLPNGVAGIRGTFFDISATGEIKVLVGAVVYAFLDASGQMVTQIISTGQQYSAANKVASPIPAPTVAELQEIARGLQVPPPGFVRRTIALDRTIWPASPVNGQ
jgi:hypothetical protein